jgi:outer membrane immunogenic protein
MKSMIAAAAGLLLASASVQAADLPSSKMAPMPPVFLAYNWTGFYVGVQGGAAFAGSNSGVDVNGYNAVGEVVGLGSRTGFIGGATIGVNYQISQIVLGVEADISYLNYRARGNSVFFGGDLGYQARANWLGTIRGRIGLAIDRALIYVTGGVAAADLRYSAIDVTAAAPGLATINARSSQDWGWALGGGLEYAVTNNITVKGEYLYTRFRGRTAAAIASTALPFSFRFGDTNLHIVRVGLNYKF